MAPIEEDAGEARTWNPYLEEARAENFGRPDKAAMDAYAKKALAGRSYAPLPVEEREELVRISTRHLYARDRLVAQYSWAIPNEEALTTLARYAPLIEIGAGTGYWAALLRERGVDILAYDETPPTTPTHENGYHHNEVSVGTTWIEVGVGGPEMVAHHPKRTLFLCWPPYDEPMAAECLRLYQGDTFLYVGEDNHGCTGDDTFHEMLAVKWEQVERVWLPTWDRIHDALYVYRRKKGA